jgi:acyl carrier protein
MENTNATDDTKAKLARCFALAFPKLDASQYAAASAQNMAEWDSIAQLTLLTLIGEEFGREIDFEEFDGADSFEALARILQVQ